MHIETNFNNPQPGDLSIDLHIPIPFGYVRVRLIVGATNVVERFLFRRLQARWQSTMPG